MAEIVRAGIISVDEGQTEAAHALGMTRLQTMRRIVLPQAMRVIVPPTGNETISMLKTSSLAATITVGELLFKVQNIYGRTYQTIPLLMVASLWYLIVTSVLTFGQYYVERYFARGATRQLPPTPLQRLRTQLGRAVSSRRDVPAIDRWTR
jgi:polar amino acid transport system permease protein